MKKPLLDTSLLAVPFKGAAGIKEVCFIGIGGIGMSALARFSWSRELRLPAMIKRAPYSRLN